MSKQPEALRLAELMDDTNAIPSVLACCQTAVELVRLHTVNAALLDALQDIQLNVNEAMKTGGWVPTPLQQSFWESMVDVADAIALAKEQQ